jgi:hypothetical protein
MDGSDEDDDFHRWYGPWASPTPTETATILADLDAPWWVVGGWAIDAFSGRHREHDDIDVGFFRSDLPAVLDLLGRDYCVWSNLSGTLRPLRQVEDLLDGCRQLWVRRDGSSPWLIDLAMTPRKGDAWIWPRDEPFQVPFDEAVFVSGDGIRYLRPELVLAFKSRGHVRHAEADFDAAVPLMSEEAQARLAATIARLEPNDPWLTRLGHAPRA